MEKTKNPDEYFNNGIFEMARYGNQTIVKNNMTPEDFEKYQNYYAYNFVAKKAEIDEIVKFVRNDITKCDPLLLLQYCRDMTMMAQLGKHSEISYSEDDNIAVRALEYVQSVIVSTKLRQCTWVDDDKHARYIMNVFEKIAELYKKVYGFYIYWGYNALKEGIIESELVDFIIEAQSLYLVRGNRYQIFQLEPLKKLLPAHDDIMVEVFDLSTTDILTGLGKLEHSLSQGRADAWNNILKSYEKFLQDAEEIENLNGIDSKEILAFFHEHFSEPNEELFIDFEGALGVSLNDVKSITNWNDKFIRALSFQVGEYQDFFNDSEYSGWPVVELPTSCKPFITFGDKSYCFDYYSLFDNFYRVIQKEIAKQRPDYVDSWNSIQAQASEEMVEEILCRLLPGAQTFRDNYYPVSNSLKQMNENDLLVIFDDVLIIVEIKAGSFPQSPPIVDFNAHIKAYKTLIEKADHQCERTQQYINSHPVAKFYAADKKEKLKIEKCKIREIFTLSITIDNINSFANRAEKMNFLNLKSSTISISFDDLLSYTKYFDSPLNFLHFLRQRKLATSVTKLLLYDELDHLGMYIQYNVYPVIVSEVADSVGKIFFHGYREELDNYLCRLHYPKISIEKPEQKIPSLIKEMISVMDEQKTRQRTYLSSFLLDFSDEARNELVDALKQTFNRKLKLARPLPLLAFGGIRYCVFVNIEDMPDMDYNDRQDYVYATALRNRELSLTWIDLYVDKSFKVLRVEGRECQSADIDHSDYDRIYELSLAYAKSRVDTAKRNSPNGKIGRNNYCPCGSEKKFKRCCINSA
jgi:hypothetical protein